MDVYAAQDELSDYGGAYAACGNAFDESGGGCEWNGMATDCRLLDFIARTQQLDRRRTGARTQGHEGGGFALGFDIEREWVKTYGENKGENGGKRIGPKGEEIEVVNITHQQSGYWLVTVTGILPQQRATQRVTGRQREIDDAIYDVQQIFNGDNDCTRLFGGMDVAPYILQKLQLQPGSVTNRNTGIQMTLPGNPTGVYQNVDYRLPTTPGVVNTDGPFFNTFYRGTSQRRPNIGPYSAGTQQARVLMILHEFAHLIRRTGGANWLIPNDGPQHPNFPDQSRENTETIHDVCGDEIDFVTGG